MPTTTGRRTTEIPTRLLVLGMTHESGTIDAAELYAVAEACGQTADQVRSCLRRLVADGLFVRKGSGATAKFEATPAGLSALGSTIERTRLAYAQDMAGRGWDRQWRLVAFAVPESRRPARDAFRDRLLALGGAAVQGGLYVSPHPWHKDVQAEADRLGLSELVAVATTDDLQIGGERDPRELVRRLWPIEELARRYTTFVDHHSHVLDSLAAYPTRCSCRERSPWASPSRSASGTIRCSRQSSCPGRGRAAPRATCSCGAGGSRSRFARDHDPRSSDCSTRRSKRSHNQGVKESQ